MSIDAKLFVLYAIYVEYQKDLPDMEAVTAEALGIDEDVFNVAVLKLCNEGYITGAEPIYVDQLAYPVSVDMSRVMPTQRGIESASGDLAATARTGGERVRQMAGKFIEYGWQGLTDFAAKVLVEIGKHALK